jgi:hypothetical protein
LAGAFFASVSILAKLGKLFCHGDVLWFVGVERFEGLTCEFAGVFVGTFCKWFDLLLLGGA